MQDDPSNKGNNDKTVETSCSLTCDQAQVRSASPSRSRLRFNPQDAISQLCSDDLALLRRMLSRATLQFIAQDVAVYLEGFGILIPDLVSHQRVKHVADRVLVQTETFRSLRFEKCGDLVAFHREKFGSIVETKEICELMYQQLSRWSERELRVITRGLLQQLRQGVVTNGHNHDFPEIGEFFALHNRQGSTLSDWFAGSDIFVRPTYRQTLVVEPSRMMQRPVLHSSWEILEAAYGPPACILQLDLIKELGGLGYEQEALTQSLAPADRTIPVGVFVRLESPQALIYVTDGLRRLAADVAPGKVGSELVFQLGLAHTEGAFSAIPDWPLRPLTLGWILIQSSRSKSLRPGAGLACGSPLIPQSDSELESVFTTQFAPVRNEQLSTCGEFTFANIVGITADETEAAGKYSAEYLLKLLEYKELDQHTKPWRSSIVSRSHFCPQSTSRAEGAQNASKAEQFPTGASFNATGITTD
ncbi:MAG: suppressor of fused domain protein [Oligoflexia bacterium]|nr:suppressor of fused domain protein [Oligoflexia bacterium]